MGYNYSKGLVLTLRDSSTGSPWSPGSCSLLLSAVWLSHHFYTALKNPWYFQGKCGSRTLKTVQMTFPPPPHSEENPAKFFFTLAVKDEGVFNEFCRAGCVGVVYDSGHDNRLAPPAAKPLPADSKQLFALLDVN